VDDLAVGAPLAAGVNGRSGRVYVFNGGPTPSRSTVKVIEGAASGERFGAALAAAGDLNGDGREDLAIGAPEASAAGAASGAVRAVFGGSDLVPDLEWTGSEAGGWLGSSLSGGPSSPLLAGAPLAGRVERLSAPRYVLVKPVAGERWFGGGTQEIRWRGAEPARVSLSLDDGRTWTDVANAVGGSDANAMTLRVPAAATDSAWIRLSPVAAEVPGEARTGRIAIRTGGTLSSFQLGLEEAGVRLTWKAEPGVSEDGWLGFRIYRTVDGVVERVGPELITGEEVVLPERRRGARYALRAVNGAGEEQELGSVDLPAPPRGIRAWPVPSGEWEPVELAMEPPLEADGRVARDFVVRVYGVDGRQVRFLASGNQPTVVGEVRLSWDRRTDRGGEARPGVYFVRAEAPSRGWRFDRRVVLIR
jgi:FG-GAP repeat protein